MAPHRGHLSHLPPTPTPTPLPPAATASASGCGANGGARPIYSCEPCRRRKVKCDGTAHCKNCRRRGDECRWVKTPARTVNEAAALHTKLNGSGSTSSLAARIERIEETLCTAGLMTSVQTALTSPLSLSSSSPLSQTGPAHRLTPPRTVAIAISDLVESADRFDHQIISADVEDQEEVEEDLAGGSGSARQQAQLQTYSALLRHLPPRAQCDALVSAYFEQLEWIHHPIHVPIYMDWYKGFWTAGVQSRLCLQRLALLFSILCLAVHFDLAVWPEVSMAAIGSDAKYHQASQDALSASDYLANHSMAVIQTLILQGLYLNNCGRADTHHANLALAIRMANGLGLSQIDAGRSSRLQHSGNMSTMSSLDVEMGRRIYWSLVCQDCYTASSCNFTYNIPPSQIKTNVFADLRDDEISAAQTSPSQEPQQHSRSLGLPTTSTYHREKIAFALTARKAVDLYNEDRLTHDVVPELERENLTNYAALPHFLRLDRAPWQSPSGSAQDLLGWGPGPSEIRSWNTSRILSRQLQWQRLFLGFTIHNRTMRLNRAYLARGYTDAKYTGSKNATLRAAVSLLELLEEAKRINFPLQWWVVLIHVFTASVALCIDLHMGGDQRQDLRDGDVEGRRNLRLIQTAISVLQEASRKSKAAKRAVRVVETLLTQSQYHRDEVVTTTAAQKLSTSTSASRLDREENANNDAAADQHQPTSWESALEGWLSQSNNTAASMDLFGEFDESSLEEMSSPGYLSKELLDTINSFASSLS